MGCGTRRSRQAALAHLPEADARPKHARDERPGTWWSACTCCRWTMRRSPASASRLYSHPNAAKPPRSTTSVATVPLPTSGIPSAASCSIHPTYFRVVCVICVVSNSAHDCGSSCRQTQAVNCCELDGIIGDIVMIPSPSPCPLSFRAQTSMPLGAASFRGGWRADMERELGWEGKQGAKETSKAVPCQPRTCKALEG